MTTDNVAEMTPEQLRDELAATKRVAQLWFHRAMERKKELAQTHIELRQIRKLWLNPTGAADLRRRLKDLRGAKREFGQQLADVTSNREFWYKEAKDAEIELDRVRQDAQDQSDEVQELWLCPVKAEGLKRQLAKAQMQAAIPKEATMWLWGFYDGNTLVAKPGYEDDIREAWNKLLIAVDSIAGDALLERLAILDAAEAALADCGIGGIYAAFDGLADAVEQMSQYIDELTREDERRTEQTKALQAERQLRRKAERRAETAEAANRILWDKDTERAETLAQLVTKRATDLLERLANHTAAYADSFADPNSSWTLLRRAEIRAARKLAAQIREVLDDSQA